MTEERDKDKDEGKAKVADVIKTISCLRSRFPSFLRLTRPHTSLSGWTFSDAPRHPRIFVSCVMVSKKRSLEDAASPKAKKSKLAADGSTAKKEKRAKAKVQKPLEHASNVVPEDIDFPRGGGTSFTAQEVKAIRAEAMKEADDLFKVRMRCLVSIFPRLRAA